MPSRGHSESIPVEAFLEGVPAPHRELAEQLRLIVMAAVPDAVERVRPGWGLIGYDLPIRRRAFFAWIWPEPEHVHLGFVNGVLMDDPGGTLRGDGVTKRARWLTFEPGDQIDDELATRLVREAARVAMIPRSVLG